MNSMRAWGAFLLVSAFSVAAAAQTFRGTILGTATDTSGAAVVGAKVTVRNVATGLVRETETTGDGSYAVPELPIGTYDVTVEKSGFQTSVTKGVTVEVAHDRRVDATLRPGEVAQRVDATLQPGAVSERVEVSGKTLPLTDTTSNVAPLWEPGAQLAAG